MVLLLLLWIGGGGVTKVTFMIEHVFRDKRPSRTKKERNMLKFLFTHERLKGSCIEKVREGNQTTLGKNAQSNDKNKQQ